MLRYCDGDETTIFFAISTVSRQRDCIASSDAVTIIAFRSDCSIRLIHPS